MKPKLVISLLCLLAVVSLSAVRAAEDEFTPDPGFVSLFNGKDLTGWGYRAKRQPRPFNAYTNDMAFDGKTESIDARYSGKDGIITVHPKVPRVLRELTTTKDFPKDFILKLEFRADDYADSGLFLRGEQLQIRDYKNVGPYKTLRSYKSMGWNLIEVTVKDNVAHCTCNGDVIEDALKIPATGGIGFEADRGQVEYRHIQIKELP